MDRIARIIKLERSADAKQKISDADRWEASRLIAEELDGPPRKTLRALGAEIGRSHTHVRRMAAVWRHGQPWRERRTFHALYASAFTLSSFPGQLRRWDQDDGAFYRGPVEDVEPGFQGPERPGPIGHEPTPEERREHLAKARVFNTDARAIRLISAAATAGEFARKIDPKYLTPERAAEILPLLERTALDLQRLLDALRPAPLRAVGDDAPF